MLKVRVRVSVALGRPSTLGFIRRRTFMPTRYASVETLLSEPQACVRVGVCRVWTKINMQNFARPDGPYFAQKHKPWVSGRMCVCVCVCGWVGVIATLLVLTD